MILTPWRIEMLGWLCAKQGTQTVTRFRTKKTALLLVRLALSPNRSLPREEIADLLWPDSDLESGRSSLRQCLATLRRHLEPPGTPAGSVLIADRTAVRLRPGSFTTDVADFEAALAAAAKNPADRARHLQAAAGLYSGEFLPGFYDDWVIEERERLTARWSAVEAEAAAVPEAAPPPAASEASPAALPRLPLAWTRFFGRGDELRRLAALLEAGPARLVTLTGAGGTGKTRLAVEAARQAAPRYGGRVFFMPLADLSDPSLLWPAIAAALDLSLDEGAEPLAQIAAALAAPTLLVADNLEHLAVPAAASLFALLCRAPCLSVLATSRQRLFVAGEREMAILPLAAPGETASPEEMMQIPAVQLFVDRAQAARSDFQITPRNAAAVGTVCRQLEGIPLALELAAAWAQVLTPAQMAARLAERFSLSVSRRKDVPERHQTLRGAIAWSCNLLPPDLARLWAALSVFRGGFTADAAAAVCDATAPLDDLGRLQARSLVFSADSGEEMRFSLLETLREYGRDRLNAAEEQALGGRHARFFLGIASEAEAHLRGPRQAEWLARLDRDADNLRAALAWCREHDGHLGLELAGALWRFWMMRGHLTEGRAALAGMLAQAMCGETDPALRGKAWNGAGVLAYYQGDTAQARECYEKSLALMTQADNAEGIAVALNNLGLAAENGGDYAAAEGFYQKSLALFQRLGDSQRLAGSLCNIGNMLYYQGKFAQARPLYEESLALRRALEDGQGIVISLGNLANDLFRLGDRAAADLMRESLVRAQELGDRQRAAVAGHCLGLYAAADCDWAAAALHARESLSEFQALGDRWGMAGGLESAAVLAAGRGLVPRAAQLWGAAERLRREIGSPIPLHERPEYDRHVAAASAALGPALFCAAWSAGAALPLEQAVALALCEPG